MAVGERLPLQHRDLCSDGKMIADAFERLAVKVQRPPGRTGGGWLIEDADAVAVEFQPLQALNTSTAQVEPTGPRVE